MLPPGSSLSDLDHETCDFGPGSEFIKVLTISFIILLLGTARLHTLMEYLNTSRENFLNTMDISVNGIIQNHQNELTVNLINK
jgi:hypothetical protein